MRAQMAQCRPGPTLFGDRSVQTHVVRAVGSLTYELVIPKPS